MASTGVAGRRFAERGGTPRVLLAPGSRGISATLPLPLVTGFTCRVAPSFPGAHRPQASRPVRALRTGRRSADPHPMGALEKTPRRLGGEQPRCPYCGLPQDRVATLEYDWVLLEPDMTPLAHTAGGASVDRAVRWTGGRLRGLPTGSVPAVPHRTPPGLPGETPTGSVAVADSPARGEREAGGPGRSRATSAWAPAPGPAFRGMARGGLRVGERVPNSCCPGARSSATAAARDQPVSMHGTARPAPVLTRRVRLRSRRPARPRRAPACSTCSRTRH